MRRFLPRVLALTAVLGHAVVACDGGDLNPQPLPPVDSSGHGSENDPSKGGASGDNAATPTVGGSDAGAVLPGDAGDAGDASDARDD